MINKFPRSAFMRAASVFLFLGAVIGSLMGAPHSAQAAVSNWTKGATIAPRSTEDFGTDAMKRSLDALRATGANYVALLVPYYQSNIYSTDIAPGSNTPSDASLVSAIKYAHSIGLAVMIKVHPESYGGEWRANIDPWSRQEWFSRYGALMNHLGTIGKQNGVEMISIGTELVRLTSTSYNASNTGYWQSLIGSLRTVYSGKITYGANSTYNSSDQYSNEKIYVGFWSAVDYVSLSPYYNLDYGSNNVSSLMAAWDYWNKNDIQGFQANVGKPILFGEIGYRSITGAYQAPWDWGRGGSYDEQEQANDYTALMQYWNQYPYMQGVFWWNWPSDLSQSYQGNTDYFPSAKKAEGVMKQWFGGASSPAGTGTTGGTSTGGGTTTSGGGTTSTPAAVPSTSTGTFTIAGSVNPAAPVPGSSTSATADITNSGGSSQNVIVDLEVYNGAGTRVAQKFVEGQNFANGQVQHFTVAFTAAANSQYTLKAGIFSSDWSRNFIWNDSVVTAKTSDQTQTSTTTGGGTTTSGGSGGGTSSTPTQTAANIDIWWPTANGHVSGVQPFKALVTDRDVSTYSLFWQVDGHVENSMYTSTTDYPHKEAMVDVSGWSWNGAGPYRLTFGARDASGILLTKKDISIMIDR